MRRLLELFGIKWYSLGDEVMFFDGSGFVRGGYIRERSERRERGYRHWMFTTTTYTVEVGLINTTIVYVNENHLIRRV